MSDDDSFRELGRAEEAALAFADGRVQFGAPPATREEAQALLARVPKPTDLGTVVRPVRLPFDTDRQIKQLAEGRGTTISALIREWVDTGLAAAGQPQDPVTELRRDLTAALRAVEELARRRDAA